MIDTFNSAANFMETAVLDNTMIDSGVLEVDRVSSCEPQEFRYDSIQMDAMPSDDIDDFDEDDFDDDFDDDFEDEDEFSLDDDDDDFEDIGKGNSNAPPSK